MLTRVFRTHPDDVQIAETKKKNKKPTGKCSQLFARNAAKKDKYRFSQEIPMMCSARTVLQKNAQREPRLPKRLTSG